MIALATLLLVQGLELQGAVTDTGGRPVGGASVFVTRARPRRGVGTL